MPKMLASALASMGLLFVPFQPLMSQQHVHPQQEQAVLREAVDYALAECAPDALDEWQILFFATPLPLRPDFTSPFPGGRSDDPDPPVPSVEHLRAALPDRVALCSGPGDERCAPGPHQVRLTASRPTFQEHRARVMVDVTIFGDVGRAVGGIYVFELVGNGTDWTVEEEYTYGLR